MIARAHLERDVVILACAISAGIHAALVPSHLDEGRAAAGFAASAVLLGAFAVAITRSDRPLLLAAAAAVFAGLIASYALAVTTGVPLLHPHPEPVEGLALSTKAVELLGLLAAAHLPPHPRLFSPQPKGIAT
jgi:hypothetical protein